MITTTIRRIVPEEFISPLKALGKYDWVRWTPLDTTPPSSEIELRLPNHPALLKCHDPRTKYILSFRSGKPGEPSTHHIMSPRWKTVEEALRFGEDDGDDLAQRGQRLGFEDSHGATGPNGPN